MVSENSSILLSKLSSSNNLIIRGYKDSGFYVNEKGEVRFAGDRYHPLDGPMSEFAKWFANELRHPFTKTPKKLEFPKHFQNSTINDDFMNEIRSLKFDYSLDGEDRFYRCHGQTFDDIVRTRENLFTRIPDIVIWPTSHSQVVTIVDLANKFNVVLIAYGGGTGVTSNVTCPVNETRSIAVVDTSQMNRMLWIDKESLIASFESGIIGEDLDRVLAEEGFKTGHEPDSSELSSLGGWIATRASGMKKNTYGNIEDIVVGLKMVTSRGVFEKNNHAPRSSCGPDFTQIVIGSEGTIGIVTEVQLKIRPLPEVKKFGAIIFEDFQVGLKFAREVAKQRCQPASFRLIDNAQFRFGQNLKIDGGKLSKIGDFLKKFYLTKIKRFDLEKISVVSLVYEGSEKETQYQENLIRSISEEFGGYLLQSSVAEKSYVK